MKDAEWTLIFAGLSALITVLSGFRAWVSAKMADESRIVIMETEIEQIKQRVSRLETASGEGKRHAP